jgi:hypothetical protein
MSQRTLATTRKFKVAWEDTFDHGTFALTVLFAGGSQLTNSNPSGKVPAALGSTLEPRMLTLRSETS